MDTAQANAQVQHIKDMIITTVRGLLSYRLRLTCVMWQAKEEARDIDQKAQDDYEAEKARMVDDAVKTVSTPGHH